MSVSTENYIKVIYALTQQPEADTKPGSISRELGISNAAATDMARKLSARKLINYTKYQQITLTKNGEKMALDIIRKHRLWETFLHKVLKLSLHEIHQEAENLEHQTSDFLADKISSYLGNPSFDPHGDPIPALNGSIKTSKNDTLLSQAAQGKKYIITRLSSSDKDFFEFCNTYNIQVGFSIFVVKQFETKKMTEVLVNDVKLLLNNEFSSTIYVKPF